MKRALLALIAVLLLWPTSVVAQQIPAQPVYSFQNQSTALTLAAQATGTVNSNDFTLHGRGLICVFNQSAHTGTPSTTFAIQIEDETSGLFVTILTSAAITADATPTTLEVYPGIQTATLPAGITALNFALASTWRIQVVVGGTTPTVTATVGCTEIS